MEENHERRSDEPEEFPEEDGYAGEEENNDGCFMMGCLAGFGILAVPVPAFIGMLLVDVPKGTVLDVAVPVVTVLLGFPLYAILQRKPKGFAHGISMAMGIVGLVLLLWMVIAFS